MSTDVKCMYQGQITSFFIPTVTLVGPNCSKEIPNRLKSLGAKHPLIVTDKGIVACGILKLITDILDAGKSVYDVPIDDIEVHIGFVYRWGKDLYSHLWSKVEIFTELVRASHFVRQVRCQELRREVCLEIGGLVCNDRVGHCMAFIEAIACKRLENMEDPFCCLCRISFLDSTVAELHKFSLKLVLLFLAHDPPEDIGLSESITGNYLGNLHYLFLINDDSVCCLEDVLEIWMRIFYLPDSAFAVYVLVDELHRPRTVERIQAYKIFDLAWLCTLQDPSHSC